MTSDQHNEDAESDEILKKFRLLPARYANRQVHARIVLESKFAFPQWADRCVALGLPIGDTLEARATLASLGSGVKVFATGEIAESLVPLKRGTEIEARVRTLFGIEHHIEYGPDGSIDKQTPLSGLRIIEVLSHKDVPENGADAPHSIPKSCEHHGGQQ